MPAIDTATTGLSTDQRMTLIVVCDTLAPSVPAMADQDGESAENDVDFWQRTASDLHIPALLEKVFTEYVDEASQSAVKLALGMLENPAINLVIARIGRGFSDCDLETRTRILRAWAASDLMPVRQAFQAFKRLTLFYFYTATDANQRNPNWPAIHYPGPPTPPENADKPIRVTTLKASPGNSVTLTADVVIIGSGAGGGVTAATLAHAGADVIVLEKGKYHSEADFHGRELASHETLFDGRGLLATDDLSMPILAGSSLGGGTTINWSASFRTPPHVLEEWSRVHGVTGFQGAEYQTALDVVCTRLNVNNTGSHPNFQNAALERGGNALGYKVGVIARNTENCEDCGFCGYGCQFGAKNSTTRTFLRDAFRDGARIITNAEVERILIENGRAAGVTGRALDENGIPVTFTIRAKVVVASGGALQTPALLLRSGLTNAHVGRNLHLHPTTVSFALYDEPVRGWSGPIMTRYVSQFSQITDGYGVSLQTAPVHPGLVGMGLGWHDGASHKALMTCLDRFANIIVITRDRDSGRVYLDRSGRMKISYSLSAFDRAHMQAGLLESIRIHRAAGATEIGAPHTAPNPFYTTDPTSDSSDRIFEKYLQSVQSAGLRKNDFTLISAHQMGTARMGGSPALGAINPHGESFEVRNLFIADGSALPTALGVNPMITIMSVAHQIAAHVVARVIN